MSVNSNDAIVRVMVVEDDRGTRDHFAGALRADPRLDLVAALGTGREAMAHLANACPDVLLVDLGLPDVHGTEVIRYAARTLPACDVMVISVFADERNVFASIEAGAVGYVLKESRDADLVSQILSCAPAAPR